VVSIIFFDGESLFGTFSTETVTILLAEYNPAKNSQKNHLKKKS
jgi:hypothetical protein